MEIGRVVDIIVSFSYRSYYDSSMAACDRANYGIRHIVCTSGVVQLGILLAMCVPIKLKLA
mgnify:CR=1 FL=1